MLDASNTLYYLRQKKVACVHHGVLSVKNQMNALMPLKYVQMKRINRNANS